jgi:hypothetical protein
MKRFEKDIYQLRYRALFCSSAVFEYLRRGVLRLSLLGMANRTGGVGMANRTRGVVVDRRPGRRLFPPTTPLSPVVARVLSPTASIISDTFVPTQEQRAILEASFGLGDVVKIDATAGSGKTSVLRSLVHIHANRGRVLYLVFSKALQIAERNHMTCPAGKGVTVLTLDALAAQHTAELHGGRVSSTLLLNAECC